MERAVDAIRREPGDTFPLRQMAQEAGLSPFHFLRVFRANTGLPPGEFLAAVRLQEAKRLLLTTSLSVTEVCFEVGYSSLGTFSARFARGVGVPPSQFRQLVEPIVDCVMTPLRRGEFVELLEHRPPGRSYAAGVAGRVHGADVPAGLVFVALFPKPVPQSRPVACAVLPGPGPYRLAATGAGPIPDGRYWVMAAAIPWSDNPLEYFLPGPNLRVGISPRPARVVGGQVIGGGPFDVVLRPVLPTDPPVLVASPLVLAEVLGEALGEVRRKVRTE